MDLISPIVATWVRSSSHSPRLRNLRARYSTSGRCSSTSSPRIRRRSSPPSGSVASCSKSSPAPPPPSRARRGLDLRGPQRGLHVPGAPDGGADRLAFPHFGEVNDRRLAVGVVGCPV